MTDIQSAVIKTLAYSQVFSFPLRVEEIHYRLIGLRASQEEITNTLSTMRLFSREGYYSLNQPPNPNHRRKRERISRQKTVKAQKMLGWLSHIPSIEAVYLTGSVAVSNASPTDDIDVMVITKPASLWRTRLLINLLLDAQNLRRKPNQTKLSDKLCLNMWLSADNLTIPPQSRNLYTAYEVIQTQCLWQKNHTHDRFLYQNRWVKQFLPNVTTPPNPPAFAMKAPNPGFIEKSAYYFQLRYMQPRQGREVVSLKKALFHPRDTGGGIVAKYQKICQKFT